MPVIEVVPSNESEKTWSVTCPPVSQLKSELLFIAQDLRQTDHRFERVSQYLEVVKGALREQDSAEDGDAIRNNTLSMLFVSGVEYFGHSAMFVQKGRGNPGWHTGKSQPFLYQAATARKDILENTAMYEQVFCDESDELLYKTFEAVMQDARCVVIGNESLNSDQIRDTRSHIAGILAEYKVLVALHEAGWVQAAYSSPENDLGNDKVDIVLPLDGQEKPLGIQVKGRQSPYAKFYVRQKIDSGTVWVTTPMHEKWNQFKLEPTHAEKLARRIAGVVLPKPEILPASLGAPLKVVPLAA